MNSLVISVGICLCCLLGSIQKQDQDPNIQEIKQYYTAIENYAILSNGLKKIESKLTWERITTMVIYDDKYTITVEGALENHWVQVEITNLRFSYSDNDSIVVRGIISGRQPSQCDYVSSTFEHRWTKKRLSNQITNHLKN